MRELKINSKNIIGWLRLVLAVYDLEPWVREKIKAYINRTDYVRRQKEIDDIFGGGEW